MLEKHTEIIEQRGKTFLCISGRMIHLSLPELLVKNITDIQNAYYLDANIGQTLRSQL